jgi:hypothetical protein
MFSQKSDRKIKILLGNLQQMQERRNDFALAPGRSGAFALHVRRCQVEHFHNPAVAGDQLDELHAVDFKRR